MVNFTLQISDALRHADIFHEAERNGSVESLASRLVQLVGGTSRVELRPYGNRLEYSVAWYAEGDTRPYMIGGLIYFPSDNTWCVHT